MSPDQNLQKVDKTDSKAFNIAIIIIFFIVFIIFVYNCIYFKAIIDSNTTDSNIPGCSGSDAEQSLNMVYWFNIIMAIISIVVLIWAIFKTLAPKNYEAAKNELSKPTTQMWTGQTGNIYGQNYLMPQQYQPIPQQQPMLQQTQPMLQQTQPMSQQPQPMSQQPQSMSQQYQSIPQQ